MIRINTKTKPRKAKKQTFRNISETEMKVLYQLERNEIEKNLDK